MKKMLALLAGMAWCSQPHVWAVDPFDNWVNPAGGYFVAYPFYYGADKLTDKKGDTLVSDLDLKVYGNVFRYVYYGTQKRDFPWLVNILAPVEKKQVLGQEDSGLGDARFTTGIWIINNPEKHMALAPGIDIDIPTGHFDKTNAASVGDGVWRFRPLLAFYKFSPPFDFEATARYNIATENSDTKLKKGNQTILETYTGMFLNQKIMVGVHFNYISGTDDKLNGTTVADSALMKMQLGPSVQWMVSKRFNALFQIVSEIATENTAEGTTYLSRLAWKL